VLVVAVVLGAALLGDIPGRHVGALEAFADGFESGDLSAWSTVRTAGSGTTTVQTARVRSGAYAARLSAGSSGGSYAYARAALSPPLTDVAAAVDISIESGGTGGNVPILRLFDAAGARLVSLYRQNGTDNRVWVQHSGGFNATSGTLPLGRWARAEARVVTAGARDSTVEVRLDGTLIHTTTTASLGTAGVAAVQVGNDSANQPFVLYADAAAVAVPGPSPPDTTPPDTVITTGPSGTFTSADATFALAATEAGSTFDCRLDSGAWGPCATPVTYTELADGDHVFEARATDPAGNTDPAPASRAWTIDTSNPAETLFADGFENGTFSAWSLVRTAGSGAATVQSARVRSGTYAAHLSEGASGSYAYARTVLSPSQPEITAAADIYIESGGSTGNVPLLRLFDTAGTRLLSFYRQNGTDNKLWVQHSGAYNRTTGTLAFGRWARTEVHVIVAGAGASTVEVRLDGSVVHRTTSASLGINGIGAVQIGNESTSQPFVLYADGVAVTGSGGAMPPDPGTGTCDTTAPPPSTFDPGTVVVADGFESGDLRQWTAVVEEGDATMGVQNTDVHSGGCGLRGHVTLQWNSRANLAKTLPAGSREVWADGWFKVEREGADTGWNTPTFRFFAGGNRIFDVSRQNGSGSLFARYPNGSGGWTIISTGRRPSVGVWYHYRIHVVAAGNTSTAEVWMDGTRIFATSSATFGASRVDVLMIGAEHAKQDGDVAVDEVVAKAVP
jgi:phage gp37-like protein